MHWTQEDESKMHQCSKLKHKKVRTVLKKAREGIGSKPTKKLF